MGGGEAAWGRDTISLSRKQLHLCLLSWLCPIAIAHTAECTEYLGSVENSFSARSPVSFPPQTRQGAINILTFLERCLSDLSLRLGEVGAQGHGGWLISQGARVCRAISKWGAGGAWGGGGRVPSAVEQRALCCPLRRLVCSLLLQAPHCLGSWAG